MDQITNRLNNGATTPSGPATNVRIEDAALTADQTVDRIADKATTQVDRLSGSAHRAVNSTADAASTAADWASDIPQQARKAKTTASDAVCSSIRSRPFTSVASALAVGYLLGRLARI
jgi:ElaB/YqjD/DUF883 family membrane-anchored ribosome-binding protein